MIYEFQATQSYNGYDKPWAPGAGANQWDEESETGTYDINTGAKSPATNRTRCKNLISVEPSTTYFFLNLAAQPPVHSIGLFYDENETFLTGIDGELNYLSIGNRSFTTPANAHYMTFYTVAMDIAGKVAVNHPDTVTTYSPYSNICPPEGFNIWDPDNQEFIQVYAGYVNANTRELYLRPVYEEYDGEELVGPWMSSLDLYDEDSTPTAGAFVIDFGGELTSYEITPFMLQTLLDSLGIRQHFLDGASLLNTLMDQAQGRVRSEDELLHDVLHVIPIGDQLPIGLTIKPISKDVLPGLPGKFIR